MRALCDEVTTASGTEAEGAAPARVVVVVGARHLPGLEELLSI